VLACLLQVCHLRGETRTKRFPDLPPCCQGLGRFRFRRERVAFAKPVIDHFHRRTVGAEPAPQFTGRKSKEIEFRRFQANEVAAPFIGDIGGRPPGFCLFGELRSIIDHARQAQATLDFIG